MMIIIFGFEFKDKYIFYSMLTRKQMWRRQKTCLKNETSDILKSTFIEELLFKKRVTWSLYVQVRYIPNRSELEPFIISVYQIKGSENYPGNFYWFWVELE